MKHGRCKKSIFYLFLDNSFCEHFYYITGFGKKNQFLQISDFLQILKVEHKSFPMMYHLSYFDI